MSAPRAANDFYFASALEWRAALRAREISASDLLEGIWSRILAFNPAINAVVAHDIEAARAAAKVSDARLANGQARPLEGLPITIKDSLETAGLATVCGAPALADYVPQEDAVAVSRLRAAGAVIVGKTNVPIFTGDFQSYNQVYGTTCNPWNLDLTPGGSSGGAAAAVASGLCAFELGSDVGGSIRWPAHACGVFGLRTSWALAPYYGHVPPLPTMRSKNPGELGVVGPLARSAGDLDLVLSVIAGPINAQGPAFLKPPRNKTPRELRVALWLDEPFAPVDEAVRRAVAAAAAALRAAGAQVDEKARPAFAFAEAFEIYAYLNFAMTAAGAPQKVRDRLAAEAAQFAEDDQSHRAIQARAAKLDASTMATLAARRAVVKAAFADFFTQYDAILCPPAPSPAFPHDHSRDFHARVIATSVGPLPYFDILKWASLAPVANLPAAVAPIGLSDEGLPCGVQIICAFEEDRSAVAIAAMFEDIFGGFRPPPRFAV